MHKSESQHTYDASNLLSYTGLERPFFPNRNQRIPQQIIKQDQQRSKDSPSSKYLKGDIYAKEWCSWLAFPKICCRLSTLQRYYPREKAITQTKASFEETKERAYGYALTFTAVSWIGLFQFARRGRVLPILREYGRFFGTHRVFRHYLYTAVVPITLAYYFSHRAFVNPVNNLWAIHANRLNNKILDDSFGSLQVPVSRDFKVNILKSVIPQEIDIQENTNARLSLTELGDSGLDDFEVDIFSPESAEGGDKQGEEEGEGQGEGEGEDKGDASEGSGEESEQGSDAKSEPVEEQPGQQNSDAVEVTEQQQVPPAENLYSREVIAEEREGKAARKVKLSELDLDNLDIDSLNLDDIDISELGLEDDE